MERLDGWRGRRERGLGLVAIVVLAWIAAGPAWAGDVVRDPARAGDAALFWGEGYVFSVEAPPGFLVDERAGREHGYAAFVIPARPDVPDLLIAIDVIRRGPDGAPTAEGLVREETGTYRLADREAARRAPPALEAPTARRPLVSHHYIPLWREHHLSAYFEERAVIVHLFMAVPAEQLPAGALEAFAALVSSYRFVTDRVAFE